MSVKDKTKAVSLNRNGNKVASISITALATATAVYTHTAVQSTCLVVATNKSESTSFAVPALSSEEALTASVVAAASSA